MIYGRADLSKANVLDYIYKKQFCQIFMATKTVKFAQGFVEKSQ